MDMNNFFSKKKNTNENEKESASLSATATANTSSEDDVKKDENTQNTDSKAKTVKKRKRIDVDSIKDNLAGIANNKKAKTGILVVVLLFAGYYIYNSFLKPPAYKPLPNITISTKEPIHRKFNKTNAKAKAGVKKTVAQNSNKSINKEPINKVINVPTPKLKLPGTSANIETLVKQNTQSIVKATKKQEQELFDIFKIEPEQEYQIDRLINLAKKQNSFLALEQSILQRKEKIEKLLNKLQARTVREKELTEKVNMLTNELGRLKTKLGSVMNARVHSASAQMRPQAGNRQYDLKYKLSKHNPFPFTMPHSTPSNVLATSDYINELKGISVGIIYDYNGQKIAVINNNGRIYKVGVGSKVTQHFSVKQILQGGVEVSISPKSKGVFIPLSMSPANQPNQKGNKFGVVNLKSGTGNQGQQSNYSPYGNGGSSNSNNNNSLFTPPPANIVPPAIGGVR